MAINSGLNVRVFVRRISYLGTKKLNKRQLAQFCGQFQMLLASGIPLLKALQIIKDMTKCEECQGLISKVSEGESLGQAMQGFFPALVTSSVTSAEQAGNLEEVLGRLAKHYEDRAEMEDKIKSALLYPCFVMGLCLACLIVLLVFILPGFKSLFADLDAELPLFTRMIIGLGDVYSKTWHAQIFSVISLGILLARYRSQPHGALKLDQWILKIKPLGREQALHGFRTLGSLLAGGVPIAQALSTTQNSTSNRAFRIILGEIKVAVENGEQLSAVLSGYNLFPRASIQMIAVGENSGRLAEMLLAIADFYEKEREVSIKRFTSLLEPILTLIVGLVVAVIVLAMFLPMVNMISQLQ